MTSRSNELNYVLTPTFHFKVDFNDEASRNKFISALESVSPGLKPFHVTWLVAIGYCAVRAPASYTEDLAGYAGKMNLSGFKGDNLRALYSEEPNQNPDVCGRCHQETYFWPEEENVHELFKNTSSWDTCGYVGHVYKPGYNSKHDCIAILKYDYSGRIRSGTAYRWKTERSLAESMLCERCIEITLSGDELVEIDGACGDCGDHHEPVRCAKCNQAYGCGYGGSKVQASDCASCIYNRAGFWWLGCGYGSGFDMDIYRLTDTSDEITNCGKGFDPICDPCIETLLSAGKVEKVTDDAMSFVYPGESMNAFQRMGFMTMEEAAEKFPETIEEITNKARRGY